MKKLFLKIPIILGICTICLSGNVFATEVESQPTSTFSDVTEGAWYYQEVETSRKYSIINGYEDGTFRPMNNISHIEAVKTSVCSTISLNNNAEDSWETKYLKTINTYNILPENFEEIKNTPITRYEYLRYLFELLRGKYGVETTGTRAIFTDFNDEITTFMYDNNILKGAPTNADGGVGVFPDSNITRAEAVTLANRIIEYLFDFNTQRLSVEMVEHPMTESEVIDVFSYMAFNHISEIDIKYPMDVDFVSISQLYIDYFNIAREMFYNYFQTYGSCSIKVLSDGESYTVRLSFEKIEDDKDEDERFFKNCKIINQELWGNQTLNVNMTQYQMAEKIFEYICKNFSYFYDKNAEEALFNQGNKFIDTRKGICSGYVALFNTLCNYNGIDAIGLSDIVNGDLHMYTMLWLDGNKLFADPTFGDPVPDQLNYANMEWFGLTEEEMISRGRNVKPEVY